MSASSYVPLVELTRGPIVECIHFGAFAIVDAAGRLVASAGDPGHVANLRSSSKPFQALPLIEQGGAEHFGLTDQEVALMCASHSGTDEQMSVLIPMQAKVGVEESNLQCGVHAPTHEPTAEAMRLRGEAPTTNRHNCSGKHTGMLAQCKLGGFPIETYLSVDHPIQQRIIRTFAEMCDLAPENVLIGIDGCTAPTFAVPLRSAALAYARLADPSTLPEPRAGALRRIFRAMAANGDMVAGPERFDTALMAVSSGKIVSKGGAEGYQGIGLLPGALGPGSPALGITYKISDGDPSGRARPLVGASILRQLGALDDSQIEALKAFDARPITNWRKIEVGEIRPAFALEAVLAW